jgi:hypothetical protein
MLLSLAKHQYIKLPVLQAECRTLADLVAVFSVGNVAASVSEWTVHSLTLVATSEALVYKTLVPFRASHGFYQPLVRSNRRRASTSSIARLSIDIL